jgi:histidyl-tRNA synthetase
MNYQAPRGTHDLWGQEAQRLHRLEEICREVFEKYGYTELRTPTFEDVGLFVRSIGETTDIVEKEMYVFEDRKGRKFALRPEGTASVVRAYLENGLAQKVPVNKFFYMGPMFRYERPQAGRYREFYQIGAEYFANPEPSADAGVILLARDSLAAVGLTEINVHLNTLGCAVCRPAFRKALQDYFASKTDLCADCLRRVEYNPLRLLDCKIDGAKFTDLPRMIDFLCPDCAAHFNRVQELLTAADGKFQIDHRLVRGIDYYTRTIFEVRSAHVGSQDALAAGGRYDNLVQELGGPATPSVGFALGSERVLMAAQNQNLLKDILPQTRIFVAAIGANVEKQAVSLAQWLRNTAYPARSFNDHASAPVHVMVEGPYAGRSLKSQMKLADKLDVQKVYIVGEDELARGIVIVRDMKTQEQKEEPWPVR